MPTLPEPTNRIDLPAGLGTANDEPLGGADEIRSALTGGPAPLNSVEDWLEWLRDRWPPPEWASGTAYEAGAIVRHAEIVWEAAAASTSVEPGVSTDWADSWTPIIGVRAAAWALAGNTDAIPADKLPAPTPDARGGVQAGSDDIVDSDSDPTLRGWALDMLRRAFARFVPDWARTGDDTAIPAEKLVNAPGGNNMAQGLAAPTGLFDDNMTFAAGVGQQVAAGSVTAVTIPTGGYTLITFDKSHTILAYDDDLRAATAAAPRELATGNFAGAMLDGYTDDDNHLHLVTNAAASNVRVRVRHSAIGVGGVVLPDQPGFASIDYGDIAVAAATYGAGSYTDATAVFNASAIRVGRTLYVRDSALPDTEEADGSIIEADAGSVGANSKARTGMPHFVLQQARAYAVQLEINGASTENFVPGFGVIVTDADDNVKARRHTLYNDGTWRSRYFGISRMVVIPASDVEVGDKLYLGWWYQANTSVTYSGVRMSMWALPKIGG